MQYVHVCCRASIYTLRCTREDTSPTLAQLSGICKFVWLILYSPVNSFVIFLLTRPKRVTVFPQEPKAVCGGKTHARDMKRRPRALNAQEHQR